MDQLAKFSRNVVRSLMALAITTLGLCVGLSAHASSTSTPAPTATPAPTPADPGAGLSFSVSPAHSFMIPGRIGTCTELDAPANPSGDSGGDLVEGGTRLAVRHPAPHDRDHVVGAIRFPRFTLDNKGKTDFLLSYMIVRVTLPDQDYEITVPDAEVMNLLALNTLNVPAGIHIVSNDSSDSRRQVPSPYAPCGLVVNDIPITTPGLAFVAPVEVRLSGYVTDAAHQDTPVEITTKAEAEFQP